MKRKGPGPQSPMAVTRRARTLTQRDVAKIVGVSQQSYCAWENGEVVPSEAMQIRLAALFGVTPHFLFPDQWENQP